MIVMPGVIGQIGQNVADNLFEIGKSAVKATADAAAGMANESIEQLTNAQVQSGQSGVKQETISAADKQKEEKMRLDRMRYEAVKSELAQYTARKKQQEQQIAEEKAAESKETAAKKNFEKRKKESWVSKIINKASTSTERGRSQE